MLANRKEYFKPCDNYPENKHYKAAANYEPEWRRFFNDPAADQDEAIVPLGEKTNYKGAKYR